MPEENWLNDYVFTVDGFLTPQQCEHYIRISEDLGYEEALVNTPQGQLRLENVRNNERVLLHNEEIAQRLWKRAEMFAPHECEGRLAIGLNELFRFYRYDPGQQFNWHQDGSYVRDNGEESFWTLMIYLNDDFEGGETSFEDSYSEEAFDPFQVVPRQGTALFFEHLTHHQGEPVAEGRKYVLRTDVMYASEDDEEDRYEDEDGEFDNW